MVFEDDLGKAINALNELEESVDNVLELKLFFDDVKLVAIVSEVMDSIKIARFYINQIIKNFTWRSKQKYVEIIEEPEVERKGEEQNLSTSSLDKESIISYVGQSPNNK